MPFDPKLIALAEAGAESPDDWVMAAPLTWTGEFRGEPVVLSITPDDLPFTTDLASVPRYLTWLFPRYGNYTKAAVLHDYFCRNFAAHDGEVDATSLLLRDRSDADEVFLATMKELDVPWARRRLMWTAVTWATLVTAIVPGRATNASRRVVAALVLVVTLVAGWLALRAGWWGDVVWGDWAWLRGIACVWLIVAVVSLAGLAAGYVALGRWDRWWDLLIVWGMTVASVPLVAAGLAIAALLVLYLLVEDAFNGFRSLRARLARIGAVRDPAGPPSAREERLREVKAS